MIVALTVSLSLFLNNSNSKNKDIDEDIKLSCVKIDTDLTSGSGFIYSIDEDNIYVITAYHVVSDGQYINVEINNNESLAGKLLGYDIYYDLALIEIDNVDNVIPLELGDSSLLKADDLVFVFDEMNSQNVVEGSVVSPLKTINNSIVVEGNSYEYELEDIELSIEVLEGFSGSAVFNKNLEVVGIITMSSNDNKVYATPINEIINFVNMLKENRYKND